MELQAGEIRIAGDVVGYFILGAGWSMTFCRFDDWDLAVSRQVAGGHQVRMGGYINADSADPTDVHYD